VDSALHKIAEGRINHPLPFHTALPRELGTLDYQAEVALACGIVAAVAAVLFAIVDQLDPCR